MTEDESSLIREAAALEGQTVSAFLLQAAGDRAREVIERQRHIVLSSEEFDKLAAELEAPDQVVPELVELFKRPRLLTG